MLMGTLLTRLICIFKCKTKKLKRVISKGLQRLLRRIFLKDNAFFRFRLESHRLDIMIIAIVPCLGLVW
uniref:Uncharacterized protein n=1 Tax=Brassica campestris TaxID=3711 RepID=A0A3P5ZLC7_BRACM|nr:unnamed protein product [Brassica rapa]